VGIFSDVSDILTLAPGGVLLLTWPDATGLDITTNKDLNVLHDGTGTANVTYEVVAIGVD
jgi:hypothetical protein